MYANSIMLVWIAVKDFVTKTVLITVYATMDYVIAHKDIAGHIVT